MSVRMKLNWDQFRLKNPNTREAFERLCYHLFCRKFQSTEGLFSYKNQAGIETDPIEINSSIIGFQSKYFDHSIDNTQIVDSLKKAKEKNPKLNKIIFYLNQEFSESSKKGKKDAEVKKAIESEAQNLSITIEWIVPSHFDILLAQPVNIDLAQLYFGVGDEFGFIKSCCDPEKMTLLGAKEYIDIPFVDNSDKPRKDIKKFILTSKDRIWLLVGHPGSGKSISMHKLLQYFGGLDKKKAGDMRAVINRNKALPMLINLKDCHLDTLENIVRNRQADYKLRNNNFGIIYLFDGIDELDEEKADKVLTYMVRLSHTSNTKKIILSCRSGNKNRLKTKTYLTGIKEYRISDLNVEIIRKYFNGKNISQQKQLLKKLERSNPDLISKVTDILFVKLLWDTIPKLNDRSTVFDLIENKVSILLNNPFHRKNIDALNILDPKSNVILELNKDISFEFFKKYQFRFPEKELQKLILNKFPRIDYRSTNYILNYLIDMFFDGNASAEVEKQTYIYHHRRYQEYFFAQKLKDEYETDQKILRSARVLSNQEFFDHLFLPFLRREYEKENNLCRLLELNLIDVYLGRHRGWGADDPYYINSSEFIPSLAIQQDELFEQLLDDETLQIKQKILTEVSDIKKDFDKWEKDRSNYRYRDNLKGVWESGIAALLNNIVIFWKNKKFKIAKDLLKNLDNIVQIYKKREFRKNLQDHDQIRDPFWSQWENWLAILIVIRNNKIPDIFNELVRKNYSHVSDVKNYTSDDTDKGKLIKSFFRVCLRKNNEIFTLFNKFDNFEKISFLNVLTKEEFLPNFINTKSVHKPIKEFLEGINVAISEENYFLLFYKRFFNLTLSDADNSFIDEQIIKIQKERSVDWLMYNSHFKYAILSYAGSKNSFDDLRKRSKTDTFKYFNELQLYAALFNGFVSLLNKKDTAEELLREYLFYIETHDVRFRLYLQVQMSFLWAYIVTYSNLNINKLTALKNRLLRDESKIISFSFLYKLIGINVDLFNRIVNEYDIAKFERELESWNDDFPSLIDRYLGLAIFYSGINQKKAESYIAKAINEGVLRHGWRKDSVVSYHLVEALEILWRNNWVSKDILSGYVEDVFSLALRVADITDGKGTWQGPYNVIELVSNFDIELAEKLKTKLIKKEGQYNIWNWAITAVILGKVKLGLSPEIIENDMRKYSMHYDHENKPRADYYEQKFKVYLTMAQSHLYTARERRELFNKAYEQVEEMKQKGVSYYLRDLDFEDEKNVFVKLCKKYRKTANVTFEKKEKDYHRKPKMSEKNFVSAVKKANNKRELIGLYKKLGDYNNGIVLKNEKSWRILVNKTYEIMGCIQLFTDLLQRHMYPHMDFMTSNSKYFQFGLAEALNNINTKEEALHYLYKNSGHGGFLNIMRAYEVNRDKEMCLKLFKHFIEFCKFLVY